MFSTWRRSTVLYKYLQLNDGDKTVGVKLRESPIFYNIIIIFG